MTDLSALSVSTASISCFSLGAEEPPPAAEEPLGIKARREFSPPDRAAIPAWWVVIFSLTTPSAVTALSRIVLYFVRLVLKVVVRVAEAVLFHLAPCWDLRDESLFSSSSNILPASVRRSVFLCS